MIFELNRRLKMKNKRRKLWQKKLNNFFLILRDEVYLKNSFKSKQILFYNEHLK